MESERKKHWEHVFARKTPEQMSWFQPIPLNSLEMIAAAGIDLDAPIIDIGGGASLLVDHLLERGYRDLTVLDLSKNALELARARLGPAADRVQWIETDVTAFRPDRGYQLWHDRAAFHFLTEAGDQKRYVRSLKVSLLPGGQAIIAAFAPEGPVKCSGLDIVQYGQRKLAQTLGSEFVLLQLARETHVTPVGTEQEFGFYRFERKA